MGNFNPTPKPTKRKFGGVSYHLVQEVADEAEGRRLADTLRAKGIGAKVDKEGVKLALFVEFSLVGRAREIIGSIR